MKLLEEAYGSIVTKGSQSVLEEGTISDVTKKILEGITKLFLGRYVKERGDVAKQAMDKISKMDPKQVEKMFVSVIQSSS